MILQSNTIQALDQPRYKNLYKQQQYSLIHQEFNQKVDILHQHQQQNPSLTSLAANQLINNATWSPLSSPSSLAAAARDTEPVSLSYNLTEPLDYCNSDQMELINLFFKNPPESETKQIVDVYRYVGPVLIVICLMSIMLNVVILTISRKGTGVNKSKVLLLSLNLAITDLISTILNVLNVLMNTYLRMVVGYNILTPCQSLIFEALRGTALIASALHLLALAFVHYNGTVYPMESRSSIFWSERLSRTINIVSLFCWILPFTVMMAWFSSVKCQGFLAWSDGCPFQFLFSASYRYMLAVCFAVPLFIMCLIYIRIFILISRRHRARHLDRTPLSVGVVASVSAAPSVIAGGSSSVNLSKLISNTSKRLNNTRIIGNNNKLSVLSCHMCTSAASSPVGSSNCMTFGADHLKGDIKTCKNGGSFEDGASTPSSEISHNSTTLNNRDNSTNTLDRTVNAEDLRQETNHTIEQQQQDLVSKLSVGVEENATFVNPGTNNNLKKLKPLDTQTTSSFSRYPANNIGTFYYVIRKPVGLFRKKSRPQNGSDLLLRNNKLSEEAIASGKELAAADNDASANRRELLRSEIDSSNFETDHRVGVDDNLSIRLALKIPGAGAANNDGTLGTDQDIRSADSGCTCLHDKTSGNDKLQKKIKLLKRSNTIINDSNHFSTSANHHKLYNNECTSIRMLPTKNMVNNLNCQDNSDQMDRNKQTTIVDQSSSAQQQQQAYHHSGQRANCRFLSIRLPVLKRSQNQESSFQAASNKYDDQSTANDIEKVSLKQHLNRHHHHHHLNHEHRRHIHTNAERKNKKVMLTTLLILGTYMTSYLPGLTLQVLTCFDCRYPFFQLTSTERIFWGSLTFVLVLIKTIVDPFIYIHGISEFRLTIKRYISKKKSRSSFGASLYQTSQRINNTTNTININTSHNNFTFQPKNNNNNQTADGNSSQAASSFKIDNYKNNQKLIDTKQDDKEIKTNMIANNSKSKLGDINSADNEHQSESSSANRAIFVASQSLDGCSSSAISTRVNNVVVQPNRTIETNFQDNKQLRGVTTES